MTSVHNLEVILDNGGGITIQCDEFVHSYEDAQQAAHDARQILDGDDTSNWDGNDPEHRINYEQEDLRNGGYKVYSEQDLCDEMASREPIVSSWHNVRDFLSSLTGRQLEK